MLGFCNKFRYIPKILKEASTISYSRQCYLRRIHVSAITKAEESPEPKIPLARAKRFEIFKDEPPSPIIIDVEEERKAVEKKFKPLEDEEEEVDDFYGISPERGTTGVIEIEEAVQILKTERAINMVVINVPKEYYFCDYLIIVTAKSKRHMIAMSEFMLRVFKYKRHKSDAIPKIEGKNSKDWLAVDFGNINLHIFSPKARSQYDIECLWSVGEKYDPKCQQAPTPLELLMSQSADILSSLKPAEKS